MSRIYRTWCDRIDSGVFSKYQCLQWAHTIYPRGHNAYVGGHHTALTADEAEQLCARMQVRGGVLLTPEHIQQGRDWLAVRRNRAKFPDLVHDHFDHFSFQGNVLDINEGTGYREQFTPVWRIHLRRSTIVVDYAHAAWQSSKTMDTKVWVGGLPMHHHEAAA